MGESWKLSSRRQTAGIQQVTVRCRYGTTVVPAWDPAVHSTASDARQEVDLCQLMDLSQHRSQIQEVCAATYTPTATNSNNTAESVAGRHIWVNTAGRHAHSAR